MKNLKEHKALLFSVLMGCLLLSCHKESQNYIPNAEIIRFNPEKCGCCWGWYLKTGSDTIKTDDGRFGDLFGYNFTKPVPVYIELGERDQVCTSYYKIIKIGLLK